MVSPLESRRQRLRWSALPLTAAAVALVTSLSRSWYVFTFSGDVQTHPGAEVVRDVSASSTLSASAAAAASGVDWFGFPRPVVLVAAALGLGVAAVLTRLWLLTVVALVGVLPAASSQLGAFTGTMQQGPGGHLLTPGPGLASFPLAFWLSAAALVLVTVAARAVRQAEVAAEREALRAAGQDVPLAFGELIRAAVSARLRLPSPSRPPEA